MEIYTITSAHEKWERTAAFAEKCSWSAGKNLAKLMRKDFFKVWERVFAAFEDDEPVGFCTLTEKDELLPKYPYTPLIGFVFVDEAHRGKRISEKMIGAALEYAKTIGYDKVYIMSGEKGLYEKYGFSYMGDFESIYGGKDQLFVISL
ncbi:Acetyltransferase (GNAT) domain-containing protein [Ruminococcus flavefaciens]|uniref:Acetyltransferase (GNAT) domain-containing protein n=1 Tax=Ruminococcus flavefaciens TaxID=1265 RepID=A0A1H6KMH2_RUMFL|nr:GNAT family N-acetyltransferase [Ruminococcus flavefaciens]SEH76714.1 Acetyltransferase (GNAT) domain-containing protein [Ruminococcus flavefaciens]